MKPKEDISSGQKKKKRYQDSAELGLKLFRCALHPQHIRMCLTRQNTTCPTNEKSNDSTVLFW